MILKPEFAHMVNHLGLEDGELALAEIVWQKAERAMQCLPVQEAALLKKQLTFKSKRQPEQLTREEVQFLSDLNRDFLSIGQDNMKSLTVSIQNTWLKCNPDDSSTQLYFDDLNYLRSYQRKVKSHMRKLERIQHKLKKMR